MANYAIPGLRQQRNAFFWEPSATLKREGWNRLVLGSDEAKAIVQAQARVTEITAWRAAGKPAIGKTGKVRTPCQVMEELTAPILPGGGITLARLVREFELAGYPRADDEHGTIADASRKLYGYAFRRLIEWGGHHPANLITEDSAKKLARSLVEGKSRQTAATIVKAAKRLFAWGRREKRLGVVNNPFAEVQTPRTEPRKQVWDSDRTGTDYELFADACEAIGRPELALAIDLFLTLGQRTGDMIRVSSADWRPIEGLDPHLVEAFASDEGPNAGEVMGFHMHTRKTNTFVTIPVGGHKRRRIEAQIARNAARTSQPRRSGRPALGLGEPVTTLLVNEYTGAPWERSTLQRWFSEARAHAVETLGLQQFAGLQLRDLRRTAVVRMAERGVPIPRIIAITGHTPASANNILQTYMPRNVTMAAEAALTMMQHDAARDARRVTARRAEMQVAV